MDTPILILACSGRKLDHPAPAIDLYQGTLFKRGRAYAERHNMPVIILSAKLGWVQPTQVIEPYNQRFEGQNTYKGNFPEQPGFYLGGVDYFGRAPKHLQPLVPKAQIGTMVFYMDMLEAVGRDYLFAHTPTRGLQEAIVDNLKKWQLTEAELLANIVSEFGPVASLPKTVKDALRPSGAAKASGLTLHTVGDRFYLAA